MNNTKRYNFKVNGVYKPMTFPNEYTIADVKKHISRENGIPTDKIMILAGKVLKDNIKISVYESVTQITAKFKI